MLFSFAVIVFGGFAAASLAQTLKLPRIIGMLAAGILVGPFMFDFIDNSVLGISSQLRQTALIIILIRAGLSLDLSDLKRVGRPAVMMSFLPACFLISAEQRPLLWGLFLVLCLLL